jgi:hypothetical protein
MHYQLFIKGLLFDSDFLLASQKFVDSVTTPWGYREMFGVHSELQSMDYASLGKK